MDAQVFKNAIQYVHHQWLGKLLQLDADGKYGIDLLGATVGVEVKARHRDYAGHGWALAAYQCQDFREAHPTLDLYWAFILYDMSRSIAELPARDRHLARRIRQREVWFRPWEWAEHLPESNPRTGPYKYAHRAQVLANQNDTSIVVTGGTVHVPKGCYLEERLKDIRAGNEPVPF